MPKDFDRFLIRFRQFGGWRLIAAYARTGVLWTGTKALVSCIVSRQSLKAAYPAIMEKVNLRLTDRYMHIMDREVRRCREKQTKDARPKNCIPHILWSGWLQGAEQAPELVKACWRSQRQHFPTYEMRILTAGNYHRWTELPEHIERKYRKGLIPPAQFSDLLRLSVLARYGGLWLDASVYCSGFTSKRLLRQQSAIASSPFSIFRYFRRGAASPSGLSNWFIAARPGHPAVTSVLECLLAYWRDYDCTVNYYIMHHFLAAALSRLPEAEAAMPRLNSFHALLLGNALGRPFNPQAWNEFTAHVAIHKLNYRKAAAAAESPDSYCSAIIAPLPPATAENKH